MQAQQAQSPKDEAAATSNAADPAASEDKPSTAQPQWAEAVMGFADILCAEAYSAVASFYENIAAFEAARSGTMPKQQEDGTDRDYVRPPKPLRVPVSADKAHRTKVHELCRLPTLPRVSTLTILDNPEQPAIELSFHYKASTLADHPSVYDGHL